MNKVGWLDTMGKRLGIVVAGLAFTLRLVGAPSASAAIEVGSDCQANGMVVGVTLFPLAVAPENSLPIGVPTSGVATKWRVRSPGPDVHMEKLKVLRPIFAPNQAQVVAESSLEEVTDGREAFDIRIPVQAGDRFGVTGKPGEGAIACIPGRPGDVSGTFFGESQPGSAQVFGEENGSQAAVSAVIEPDRDGDGFGDETQDECPQSATTQSKCPRVELGMVPLVKRGFVSVLLTASAQVPVSLRATIVGPKPHLPKNAAGPTRYHGIGEATQTVAPGAITTVKYYFYRPLVSALDGLSKKKSMKLRFTAVAPNLSGGPTETTVDVKLKGRGLKHVRR